ncbi:MAG: GCN5-related N-acetyltransferase [Parcubacteria bacterium 34_609]|nr:MAG: GCN5-related N-acetyltransferase [Parcubacteria bacterium 34_609]KUK99421.1 MAG: GCN5-related N-acetyltransferase [Parcubacteria bacterium 32_520]
MKKVNQKILMRTPRMSDLESSLRMINSLVEEKAMLTVQKKLTLKEEKEYLEKIIKDRNSIHLFLIIDKEVMGSARVNKNNGTKNHIGELGISLRKEARGKGLGEKLMKEVISKAIKKFKLKIITLEVYSKNKIAQNLYKKMGFQKVGIIKKGIKYFDTYEDFVIMVKYIK